MLKHKLNEPLYECLPRMLSELFVKNKLPFLSAIIFGFAAHGFMLTNKIPYGDDFVAMFDKGATTVSGRYGLELMRLILPDVSMPWIYGVMAVFILAISACMIVNLFKVQSSLMKILLAGLFVSFPAQAVTMNYMFTVVPYAVALAASIAGVLCIEQAQGWKRIGGSLLIAFSCTIYQGYFSVAASFCVLLMLQALFNGEKSAEESFFYGLRLLAMLIAALLMYGLVVLVFTQLLGYPLIGEVINESQSILLRIAVAYSAYIKTFFAGYFGYVHSPGAVVAHMILLAAVAVVGIKRLWGKPVKTWLLAGVCLFLFPLSCYCLYMLADNSYIHSLALYSFFSVYVLCVVLLDDCASKKMKSLSALCFAVILFGNVLYANAWYLRNQIKFEETKSNYISLMTQVISTPGFDENSKIALMGSSLGPYYDVDKEFGLLLPQTPSHEVESVAYSQLIVSRYLGLDIPFAEQEELQALQTEPEVEIMNIYPYDGSIKKVGNYIVVKLAE